MPIKTPRLTITNFTPDMAQAVYENSQDTDTRRFVPDEVYDSVEEAREAIDFLMSCYDSTDGPFVYPVLTNEGQNIGYVQLCNLELEEEETWEIGYHIAKDFTGKGYATEATLRMIEFVRSEHEAENFVAEHAAENPASGRVIEKCGLHFVKYGEYTNFDGTKTFKSKIYELNEGES